MPTNVDALAATFSVKLTHHESAPCRPECFALFLSLHLQKNGHLRQGLLEVSLRYQWSSGAVLAEDLLAIHRCSCSLHWRLGELADFHAIAYVP